MSIYKFKSTINCNNCLSKVSPLLNKENEIKNWDVDLNHKDRILTVETDSLNAGDIISIVQKAGFSASEISK